MQIELQAEHGYVGVVAIQYLLAGVWMAMRVGAARKKYGIKYPQLYASLGDGNCKTEKDVTAYNCVQRGHQNHLERDATFFVLLFLASLSFPLYSAIAGEVWLISRVVYFLGYCTGTPDNRNKSNFGYVALIGLLVMAALTCVNIIQQ